MAASLRIVFAGGAVPWQGKPNPKPRTKADRTMTLNRATSMRLGSAAATCAHKLEALALALLALPSPGIRMAALRLVQAVQGVMPARMGWKSLHTVLQVRRRGGGRIGGSMGLWLGRWDQKRCGCCRWHNCRTVVNRFGLVCAVGILGGRSLHTVPQLRALAAVTRTRGATLALHSVRRGE